MRWPPISRFLRSHYAALLLPPLTAVALALRMWGTANIQLITDECFSWRLTQYPVGEVIKRTAADVHPPLYYLVLKAWCAGFGTSPTALRGLSAVLGMLCVPILYAVVRDTKTLGGASAGGKGGALFAAFLAAVHFTQVNPGSIARMYVLGTCLAGLSAWLLLKALASPRGTAWWSAYALCVAAFCYTHYYAFFCVFAQVVFVVLWLIARWRSSRSFPVAQALGFLFAGVVTLMLYAPWLPIFWQQTHDVHDNYWIGPVTMQSAAAVFSSWATGLEFEGVAWAGLLFAVVALAAAYGILRGGLAAWFFLLQAALPWALSLGLSTLGGRSIFLERYLVFAHLFFLGLFGVLWNAIPSPVGRMALGVCVGGTALLSAGTVFARCPEGPPTVARAMVELQKHYEPGDLVLADAPTTVNRLRYYASQAGLGPVDVKCRLDWAGKDRRLSHIAALTNEDILWDWRTAAGPPAARVWRVADADDDAGAAPSGMRKLAGYYADGKGGGDWALVLYVAEASTAQPEGAK